MNTKDDKRNRLDQVRKELHLSQKEFGKNIGITQTNVSAILNGDRELTDAMECRFILQYGINKEWFETGEGEMFSERKTEKTDFETVTVSSSVLEMLSKQADAITSQQQTIDRLTKILERQISDAKELENQPEKSKKAAVVQAETF